MSEREKCRGTKLNCGPGRRGGGSDWLGRFDDSRTGRAAAVHVIAEQILKEAGPISAAGLAGWLGRKDSNLRMAAPKAAALPLGDSPRTAEPAQRPERLRHSRVPDAGLREAARG